MFLKKVVLRLSSSKGTSPVPRLSHLWQSSSEFCGSWASAAQHRASTVGARRSTPLPDTASVNSRTVTISSGASLAPTATSENLVEHSSKVGVLVYLASEVNNIIICVYN